MDIWSREKRSEVMSKIKGKDTKPELTLRSKLFKLGFRFRIHVKDLPGKPDLVFPKYKTIIFVHGCFWHYHSDCKEGKIPSTNSTFWSNKLEKNVTRDKKNIETLEQMGWNVIIIWECEIEKNIENSLLKITEGLHQNLIKNKKTLPID